MNLQSIFLSMGLLFSAVGLANEKTIDRGSPEYLELFVDALDKKSTKPIHPLVIDDLKCRYLVLDLAASLVGLDDDDAIVAGVIQEALKIKVFNNDFSKLMQWWQLHKGPINTVKLCPEMSETIAVLLKSTN